MPTLTDIIADLVAPFRSSLIDLKPGAFNPERTRALAMPYADDRAYQERLDQVVGPEHWRVRFTIAPQGIVCDLTILDVTKSDVADFPLAVDEPNRATSAAAQAFKRAMARFGLRYLYALPRRWFDYDEQRHRFLHPAIAVLELYQAAGLGDFIDQETITAARPHAVQTSASGAHAATKQAQLPGGRLPIRQNVPPTGDEHTNGMQPGANGQTTAAVPVEKLARARAALAAATGGVANDASAHTSGKPASDPQLGLIVRLLIDLQHMDATDEADQIGESFAISQLSTLRSKAKLAATGLSSSTASDLIKELKALAGG